MIPKDPGMHVIELPWLLGYWGITLGNLVLIKKGLTGKQHLKTLAHERCHVLQYREEGLMFYVKYIIQWVDGATYQDISYEIEARDFANKWMEDYYG